MNTVVPEEPVSILTPATAVSAMTVTSLVSLPASAPVVSSAVAGVISFPHGSDFETKVCALTLRDLPFAREAISFLKPGHFSDVIERNLIAISIDFTTSFAAVPDAVTLFSLVQAHPAVQAHEHRQYITKIMAVYKVDLHEREYLRSNVVEFCQRQELLRLASEIPDMLGDGKKAPDFAKIKQRYTQAVSIGESAAAQFHDYFEETAIRRGQRDQRAAGFLKTGVSTGIDELDKLLYHGGWGRGELTIPMAPAKRGKTAFVLQSAIYSVLNHHTNALFISCEVGLEIIGDRLDACLTNTTMDRLIDDRANVEAMMKGLVRGSGKMWVERYPSNTLTTDGIDALVQYYFDSGRPLDLVVVDYIGILKLKTPDDRFVGLGLAAKELRRIAGKYNVAVVAPAQTNRDAVGKQVAGMDSIGESFAIVQDCDLLLSINANEQEMATGVRRICLAASRNSAEFTIKVKGDMSKMRMIEDIIATTGGTP